MGARFSLVYPDSKCDAADCSNTSLIDGSESVRAILCPSRTNVRKSAAAWGCPRAGQPRKMRKMQPLRQRPPNWGSRLFQGLPRFADLIF